MKSVKINLQESLLGNPSDDFKLKTNSASPNLISPCEPIYKFNKNMDLNLKLENLIADVNSEKASVGEVISKIRGSKEMTQVELAKISAISQANLSKIEKNKISPTIGQIEKIAKALDIPLSILFFLTQSEEDVIPEKREEYRKILPLMESLIQEFFIK